jgi:hypothetical protein
LKVFGVVIDLDEIDSENKGASPYSYLGTASVSASEKIPPVTVTSAGTISYTWDVTAIAATQLYTDGNTATGDATAEATAGMNIGVIPETAPELDI